MYLGTQEIFMAEKSNINISTMKIPELDYCMYSAGSFSKSSKNIATNEADSQRLVEKIFSIFGAANSDEISRDQLIAVDKKDNDYAEHGLQMKQKTLSKKDIQIAFWGKDAERIMSEDAKVKHKAKGQVISQWDFAALLGGCYSETIGTRILITRDRAIEHLSNNKDARKALETFFDVM